MNQIDFGPRKDKTHVMVNQQELSDPKTKEYLQKVLDEEEITEETRKKISNFLFTYEI